MDLATLIAGALIAIAAAVLLLMHRYGRLALGGGSSAEGLMPSPYDVGRLAAFLRGADAKVLDAPVERLEVEGAFQRPDAEPGVKGFQTSAGGDGMPSAAAAGAVPLGAGALHQYLAIDDHVYEGIGRLAGVQYDNLADLSAKVQTYSHDLWSGLTEKALDKVGGHIGESYAAAHFEQAGVTVEWPDASNQVGWDLLLDGHEVNVKLVGNADQLYEHFAKYPDIPAVIPGDAANIPEGAFHFDPSEGIEGLLEALNGNAERLVIVDEALSHADVMEQAADATDALVGSADLLDSAAPGIPLVTLAFSGWREAKLLRNAKTDLGTAAKNLSLDVAGTGLGGFAGMKGGAIIGSAFGPVGTVAGGVIGGIGGALAGRFASNGVKEKPFKNALARLEQKETALQRRTEEEGARAERAFEEAREGIQARLVEQAEAERAALAAVTEEMRAWRVDAERLSPERAQNYVDRALLELGDVERRLQKRTSGLWSMLVRAEEREALMETIGRVQEERRVMENYRAELAHLQVVDRATLFERLAVSGLCREGVTAALRGLERERRAREGRLRQRVEEGQAALVEARVSAQQRVLAVLADLRDRMREALAPHVEAVRLAAEEAKREAARLGRA